MTTVCTECGERIESVRIIEGVKALLHLRRSHPKLYDRFISGGMSQMTASASLESGETVHFIGESIIEYDEDGRKVINIS